MVASTTSIGPAFCPQATKGGGSPPARTTGSRATPTSNASGTARNAFMPSNGRVRGRLGRKNCPLWRCGRPFDGGRRPQRSPAERRFHVRQTDGWPAVGGGRVGIGRLGDRVDSDGRRAGAEPAAGWFDAGGGPGV